MTKADRRRLMPALNHRKYESAPPVAYNWSGRREGEAVRECERCGAEYVPAMRAQRFCSRKCRMAARKEREHDEPA